MMIGCFLLFSSCKSDGEGSKTVMPENLRGTWQVINATRNNRPALSLEKARFFITQDSFSTNFLPDKNKYPYSYDGKNLRLADQNKTTFKVARKSNDTLVFSSIIKNFEFRFTTVLDEEISTS